MSNEIYAYMDRSTSHHSKIAIDVDIGDVRHGDSMEEGCRVFDGPEKYVSR